MKLTKKLIREFRNNDIDDELWSLMEEELDHPSMYVKRNAHNLRVNRLLITGELSEPIRYITEKKQPFEYRTGEELGVIDPSWNLNYFNTTD